MATQIPPVRRNIFVEGARFLSAVSEELIQRIGGSINFINERQISILRIQGDGPYNAITPPFESVDGFAFFDFDVEILDVWVSVEDQTGLTSGFTEWDIEVATASGGPWTSILSTLPQIAYNAGNDAFTHVGGAVPNTIAPVISTPNIDAGSAIRVNLTGVPLGIHNPDTAGFTVQVSYRPR